MNIARTPLLFGTNMQLQNEFQIDALLEFLTRKCYSKSWQMKVGHCLEEAAGMTVLGLSFLMFIHLHIYS